MAKHKTTATQRFLLEEQEDLERARKRAETRREAAMELGEIVMDAGGYVLSPDTLSRIVRKALAELPSAGEQPALGSKQQRAKPARQGKLAIAQAPISGREGDNEPAAEAA